MRKIARTIAIAALTAGLVATLTVPAQAADPTTCDQVTAALTADQTAKTADAKAVKKATTAVKKAKTAVKKARHQSWAKKRAAARRLRHANAALRKAKAKQLSDAKKLQHDKELSATLCTPGY